MHAASSARLQIVNDDHGRELRDRQGRRLHHWFIRIRGADHGPHTPWAMLMALRAGEIVRDTLVRRDDRQDAIAACLADDLFDDADRELMYLNELRHHYAT